MLIALLSWPLLYLLFRLRARGRENLCVRAFERLLEARIRKARDDGEIDAASDPQALALIAYSVLYTMAIRSRACESRAVLRNLATTAIDLICGRAPARKQRRAR